MYRLLTLCMLVFGAMSSNAFSRSGCCSSHRGVCGTICCDGTALSAKCGGGSNYSHTQINPNFISEDGREYSNSQRAGYYPLETRRWFLTTTGKAGAIFINIEDTTAVNGFCFGGTAFQTYTSGANRFKCFDYNMKGQIAQFLLYETKDKHFLVVGICDGINFDLYDAKNCPSSLYRKPLFYNRQGDVGDRISETECRSILETTAKYKWDDVCG